LDVVPILHQKLVLFISIDAVPPPLHDRLQNQLNLDVGVIQTTAAQQREARVAFDAVLGRKLAGSTDGGAGGSES